MFFRSPVECPERFKFLRPRPSPSGERVSKPEMATAAEQSTQEESSTEELNMALPEVVEAKPKELVDSAMQASPNVEAVPRDPVVQYAPPSRISWWR